MPSSYTTRNRILKQAAGENINTWGDNQSSGDFDLTDYALDGWVSLDPTGNVSLTTANGTTTGNQASARALKLTTATATYITTAPALEHWYLIWNATTADQTFACAGGGSTCTIRVGEIVFVACDAVNAKRLTLLSMESQRLQNLAQPTSNQDAATKLYVDNTAFSSAGGTMPGQTGNAGKLLTTNGTVASWGVGKATQDATSGELQMLADDQATVLGGMKSDTSGNVKLVNASGADRLVTATDGSVTTKSDAGVSNLLATQAFAVAVATAL